ncbi:hypothetical protein [Clostridium celatum]|uniref:Uncharacterized protein n=1 Tax=Clostridium celatum DSM 1785 TaxID=545697 RepID=L1QIG6_9CLOT|nr:hypothetical protein [Clostridium celatum]EKY27367.1 hypothetical protein HMPREF0216_01400 [Clostridium celatum DSM 1785]MCE9655833.1 hypothetical protein [Clostridium celatum]MDU3722493.1 hypothetical protein [Clostridium celatum]MDU6295753.1 hypothetical protein [Clostridium celatum]MDY3361537.1 hypothetical protein [Clostridium celatum]
MRGNQFKNITLGIIITASVISIYGCTENKKSNNQNIIEDTNQNINEDDSNKNIITEEDKEINIEKTENKDSNKEYEIFSIYTIDVNTDEKVILKNIELEKKLSVEEKLVELANEVSNDLFNSLPLELIEIKDIEEKSIAVFNFEEVGKNAEKATLFQDYEGDSWFQCFQGSAGGRVTEYTLIETLLQRNYEGEWIDGINFTYKGGSVEFEHTPKLSEIVYR